MVISHLNYDSLSKEYSSSMHNPPFYSKCYCHSCYVDSSFEQATALLRVLCELTGTLQMNSHELSVAWSVSLCCHKLSHFLGPYTHGFSRLCSSTLSTQLLSFLSSHCLFLLQTFLSCSTSLITQGSHFSIDYRVYILFFRLFDIL